MQVGFDTIILGRKKINITEIGNEIRIITYSLAKIIEYHNLNSITNREIKLKDILVKLDKNTTRLSLIKLNTFY